MRLEDKREKKKAFFLRSFLDVFPNTVTKMSHMHVLVPSASKQNW